MPSTRELHRAIRDDKWKESLLFAKSAPKHFKQPDILELRHLDPFRQIHTEEPTVEMILSVAATEGQVLHVGMACIVILAFFFERDATCDTIRIARPD